MTVLKKIESHPDVINYFKELPFYNAYIRKPKIKQLKNTDLLSEVPFYEELTIIKKDQAFKGYAMPYKVEIIHEEDPLAQLEASKSSIRNLLNYLLDEKKFLNIKLLQKSC